jgi:predicted nucleic acid-binding protein
LEIIDSRFLIEYFFSDSERVRSKASKHMAHLVETRTGIVPTIAVTEIVRYVCEKRGREEAKIRQLSLARSGLLIADLTSEIAREAGLLKCAYPNVPTGDCIIAATAQARKAKILSDDKHFDEIKDISRTWFQTTQSRA